MKEWGLINAEGEREFLKPESQGCHLTEITKRMNRKKEGDQTNEVANNFRVGANQTQMAQTNHFKRSTPPSMYTCVHVEQG